MLYPTFLARSEADAVFRSLHDRAEWKQEKIRMYGKEIDIPRLTAWYGDPGMTYTYSGIRGDSTPWLPELLEIKNRIEHLAHATFNSVLLNLYRKGADGVAWHSDDEPELGKEPVIASVSLGQERVFHMKHKKDSRLKKQIILLPHGSLLLMRGPTQQNWVHQIPKSKKPLGPRINLTYRLIQ